MKTLIKKLTLLTLTLGLLAAPAATLPMNFMGAPVTPSNMKPLIKFSPYLLMVHEAMNKFHINLDSTRHLCAQILESATQQGFKESWKNLAINRITEIMTQIKNISPNALATDHISALDPFWRSFRELAEYSELVFPPMKKIKESYEQYVQLLSSIEKKSLEKIEIGHYNINNPPMSLGAFLRFGAEKLGYATAVYGILVVIAGRIRHYNDSKIIRLCNNNDIQGLTEFVNKNAAWPLFIQEYIRYNNDQALHDSAKLGYHEIVGILLANGANIQANNYQSVTNALEKNCAKTINIIFNHLKQNNLLVDAYGNIKSEDMWAYLSSDAKMQERYTCIQSRFMLYLYLFGSTDTLDILKSFCLLNEVALARQVMSDLKTSPKNVFNINEKQFEFEGQSLLHCAAEQNNPEVIKLLFEFGHNANPKNSDGLTPLELAQKCGNQEAIDALLTCPTLNFDNNPELQDRCEVKKLLTKIPVKTGALTIAKKIDTIKYLCTLVQHKHAVQPLMNKLATIKPETIKSKHTLTTLPVNTILSFIDTKDVPKKLSEKMDGE